MKTNVQYLPPETRITLRNNRRSIASTAGHATQWGLGDNTVQEDGRTVHVSKDQMDRMRNIQ
jgi:hypothetical protein